jgi:hypothetical protein
VRRGTPTNNSDRADSGVSLSAPDRRAGISWRPRGERSESSPSVWSGKSECVTAKSAQVSGNRSHIAAYPA